MSWRGQGGRRAKGRRGEQDPELDNTAWLAELEREAARADEHEEDDWASTLRGRRAPGQAPTPPPPPPAPPSGATGAPASGEAGWQPAADPAPPSGDYRLLGMEPERPAANSWDADPAPPAPGPEAEPDWSWRSPAADPYADRPASSDPWAGLDDRRPEPPAAAPDPGRADPYLGDPGPAPAGGHWQRAGADTPTGAWSPPPAQEPAAPPESTWAPSGDWGPAEPAGREPDYPALFGELYRRSSAQPDPAWEAPPAAEPLPPSPPDPPSTAWPFEETTQSWEPSDRSFIWPSDELPSTSTEWEQPPAPSWLDDPSPRTSTPPPADQRSAWSPPAEDEAPWSPRHPPTRPDQTTAWPAPEPPTRSPGPPAGDQTAAWPAPETEAPRRAGRPAPDQTAAWTPPEPEPPRQAPGPPTGDETMAWSPAQPSAWAPPPGNGMPPPVAAGPPPADWAAAIPTDVPAAQRALDPGAATRAWRPDEAVEGEPAVPLGAPGPAGRATRPAPEPAEAEEPWPAPDEPAARRPRQNGERPARTWPRVVAVISWIVLVMVLCWYYVFPWLERVLPENF